MYPSKRKFAPPIPVSKKHISVSRYNYPKCKKKSLNSWTRWRNQFCSFFFFSFYFLKSSSVQVLLGVVLLSTGVHCSGFFCCCCCWYLSFADAHSKGRGCNFFIWNGKLKIKLFVRVCACVCVRVSVYLKKAFRKKKLKKNKKFILEKKNFISKKQRASTRDGWMAMRAK